MLPSVSFPTASVETWDRACQIKVILQQQPKMQSPGFHNCIFTEKMWGKGLKARRSTRFYFAFCYLGVAPGKAKKNVFDHLIVEANWFVSLLLEQHSVEL